MIEETIRVIIREELIKVLNESGFYDFFENNKKNKEENKYLNTEEAAKYLKCSVQTIRNRFNEGELKGYKNGSVFVFLKFDLDNFLKKNKNYVTVKSL